jgi:hypothetical protein
MRRFLVVLMAGLVGIGLLAPRLAAQDIKVEKQQMKARQKADLRALKLKEQYQKQAMRTHQVPKSVRVQMTHQMQREKRELRERQKDERQDLKDRQRALREAQAR